MDKTSNRNYKDISAGLDVPDQSDLNDSKPAVIADLSVVAGNWHTGCHIIEWSDDRLVLIQERRKPYMSRVISNHDAHELIGMLGLVSRPSMLGRVWRRESDFHKMDAAAARGDGRTMWLRKQRESKEHN